METIIETERIILRQFVEADAQAVYEFNSIPEVAKYTGDKLLESAEEALQIIREVWFTDYQKYGYGRWATIYKPDNKLIGFAGLKYIPEFNKTDVGYRFLPDYWGRGIASEVTKEIINYGFENFGLEKIIGITMPENKASSRVLEKSGLQLYKMAPYEEGETEVCNWFKITKKEFLSQQAS